MSNPNALPSAFDKLPPELWEEILLNMDDVQQLEQSANMSRNVRDVIMNENFRERYLEARRALQTERGLERWYQDVNGVLNGHYELRRPDGSTVAGHYLDGLAEYFWLYKDATGKVIETRSYQKGMLVQAVGTTEELNVPLPAGVHPMDPARGPDPLNNGGKYIIVHWTNYPLSPMEPVDYKGLYSWLTDPAKVPLPSGMRSNPPTAGDVVYNGVVLRQIRGIGKLANGIFFQYYENGVIGRDTYLFYDYNMDGYCVVTKSQHHQRTLVIIDVTSSVNGKLEYTKMKWSPTGKLLYKGRHVNGIAIGDQLTKSESKPDTYYIVTYPEQPDVREQQLMKGFKYAGPRLTELAAQYNISLEDARSLNAQGKRQAMQQHRRDRELYIQSLPRREIYVNPAVGLPENNPTQQMVIDNILYNGGHFGEFPPRGAVIPQLQQ